MMGSVVSPVKISVEIRYRWHMAVPLDKYIKRCEANGPDGSIPQRVFPEPSRKPQLAIVPPGVRVRIFASFARVAITGNTLWGTESPLHKNGTFYTFRNP